MAKECYFTNECCIINKVKTMKEKEFITKSALETKEIAKKLAEKINNPLTILLYGELAAGKTTFTQGLALGLEINKTISSPTFTIMKMYEGRLPLCHIDAYRLEGVNQDLGFEEYLDDDSVCVIEWPMYIESILPKQYLKIELFVMDEGCRSIKVTALGDEYEGLLEEWV